VRDLFFAQGVAAAEAGCYEEALRCFDEYLFSEGFALRPEDAEAWNNRAYVLCFLDQYDEAVKSCDTAIMLRPAYADPYDIKARALLRLGRYEEALPAFEKYIELAPPWETDRILNAKQAVERLKVKLSFGW